MPRRVDEQIQSWGCAFKDLETSDYVVGQAWARLGSIYLLGDQIRGCLDFPATVNAVRKISQRLPGHAGEADRGQGQWISCNPDPLL